MTKVLLSAVAEYADRPDFLEHYGVKGMKWGVRRDRRRGTTAKERKLEKKTVDLEVKKTVTVGSSKAARKKKIKDMSDDELKKRIERLRMEETLTALERGRPAGQVGQGRAFTNRMMQMSGEILVRAVAQTVTGIVVKKAFGSRAQNPDLPKKLPAPTPGSRVG